MLRKLRYFSEQIIKAGLVAIPRPAPEQAYQLEELEAKLEELETELRQINVNTEKLRRSHSELVELQLVLEKAGGQGQGDTRPLIAPHVTHITQFAAITRHCFKSASRHQTQKKKKKKVIPRRATRRIPHR